VGRGETWGVYGIIFFGGVINSGKYLNWFRMIAVYPVKIITCIQLDPDDDLLVDAGILPDVVDGRCSTDQQVGPVKNFMISKSLPWSEIFVSCFVLLPEDDPSFIQETFGYPFELRLDEVLPSLVLVCSDDVQNGKSKNLKVCANLTNLANENKVKVLLDARLKSDDKRAEARMNRPLRKADVLWPQPGRRVEAQR
jgi:hypothetical protein